MQESINASEEDVDHTSFSSVYSHPEVIAMSSTNSDNSSVASVHVISTMCGYLMKRSRKGEWHKRYFEISGQYLVYYKSSKMDKMLAAITLSQVGMIKILQDIDTTISRKTVAANNSVFTLDLKDRQLQLKAPNDAEAEKWVNQLIATRNMHANESTSYIMRSTILSNNPGNATSFNSMHEYNDSQLHFGSLMHRSPTATIRKKTFFQRHLSPLFCC